MLLDFARLSNLDNVAHFAHLGGALWEFIFVRNLKKGKDLSLWFDRLVGKLAAFKIKKRIKIVNSKKKKTKFKHTRMKILQKMTTPTMKIKVKTGKSRSDF